MVAAHINEKNIAATMVAVYLQRFIKEMRPWSHTIVLHISWTATVVVLYFNV